MDKITFKVGAVIVIFGMCKARHLDLVHKLTMTSTIQLMTNLLREVSQWQQS